MERLGPVTQDLASALIADAKRRAKARRRKMDGAEARSHFGYRCRCSRCGWRGKVRTRMAKGCRLRDYPCPSCGGRLRRESYLAAQSAQAERSR